MNTFEKIYETVKLIPRGKVATYGQIAALAGNPRWSRVVGYALHVNPDQNTIKCHRVVKRDGSLSEAFAFGGENKQRELLENEGVRFDSNRKVIMSEFVWNGIVEKRIDAVIFDFDGTIGDSITDLTLSVKEVFENKGYPVPNEEEVKNAIGNGIRNLVKKLLPKDISEEGIEEAYQIFRKTYSRRICDNTCLYDGIENIINSLLKNGVKVGVVSNKVIDDLSVIMKKLLPNIEYICGGSDDLPRKPSPVGTINLLEKMQVLPEYTVFVGDSKVDYDTAMNVKATPVLVKWGYGKKYELAECKNCVFVDNAEELEKILLKKYKKVLQK